MKSLQVRLRRRLVKQVQGLRQEDFLWLLRRADDRNNEQDRNNGENERNNDQDRDNGGNRESRAEGE